MVVPNSRWYTTSFSFSPVTHGTTRHGRVSVFLCFSLQPKSKKQSKTAYQPSTTSFHHLQKRSFFLPQARFSLLYPFLERNPMSSVKRLSKFHLPHHLRESSPCIASRCDGYVCILFAYPCGSAAPKTKRTRTPDIIIEKMLIMSVQGYICSFTRS